MQYYWSDPYPKWKHKSSYLKRLPTHSLFFFNSLSKRETSQLLETDTNPLRHNLQLKCHGPCIIKYSYCTSYKNKTNTACSTSNKYKKIFRRISHSLTVQYSLAAVFQVHPVKAMR